MNSDKFNSCELLDNVSIRVNKWLGTEKKGKEPKENVYFWIVKVFLVLIFVQLVAMLFNGFAYAGKEIIYAFGKSLRGFISSIWVGSLNIIKGLAILFIFFDNLKDFVESKYYKKLYSKDKKRKKAKEVLFKVFDILLKINTVGYLILFGVIAVLSLLGIAYLIMILKDGTLIFSPFLIAITIFVICYFVFKYIKGRIFEGKTYITRNYFVISMIVLLGSIVFLGYELSNFDHRNSLPTGFTTNAEKMTADIENMDKVVITSDSKLDNIRLFIDEELDKNEIRIETESYRTADVKYVYSYDEKNMEVIITSDLDLEVGYSSDLINLFVSTFRHKTIYNYNLLKYPNINVYINSANFDRVSVKHK